MAPFATLVTIELGPHKYLSIGFVQFVAWTFFFTSLLYLILYLLGVHKRNMTVGQSGVVYIPLALTVKLYHAYPIIRFEFRTSSFPASGFCCF